MLTLKGHLTRQSGSSRNTLHRRRESGEILTELNPLVHGDNGFNKIKGNAQLICAADVGLQPSLAAGSQLNLATIPGLSYTGRGTFSFGGKTR